MQVSDKQIKTGRVHLEWTQDDLAASSGVSIRTVKKFESGGNVTAESLNAMIHALNDGGIQFTEGNGIRERDPVRIYKGTDGFKAFMDDVYTVARDQGGEVCLYNTQPSKWVEILGRDWVDMHLKRMESVNDNFTFRATIQKGNSDVIGHKYGRYRCVPDNYFYQQSFYAYGDRLALMNFDDDNMHIFTIYNREFADSFRGIFNLVWETVAERLDENDLEPRT